MKTHLCEKDPCPPLDAQILTMLLSGPCAAYVDIEYVVQTLGKLEAQVNASPECRSIMKE